MSSMDGPPTLEFFVFDCFYNLTKEQSQLLVELLEPQRESIECSLESFEPEEQSWRSTRNAIAETHFRHLEDEINEIIIWRFIGTVETGALEREYAKCKLNVRKINDKWVFLVIKPLSTDYAYVKIYNSLQSQQSFDTLKQAMDAAKKWAEENINKDEHA